MFLLRVYSPNKPNTDCRRGFFYLSVPCYQFIICLQFVHPFLTNNVLSISSRRVLVCLVIWDIGSCCKTFLQAAAYIYRICVMR